MITAAGKRIGRPNLTEISERDVAEHPAIRRWQNEDFDDWFAGRLVHRWGGARLMWQHKMTGFVGNDYLFITNGEAVLLAMAQRDLMTGQPWVMERLAWARGVPMREEIYSAQEHEADALRPLYRRMREWADGMKATFLYTGICSDMPPSALREFMGVKASHYVVRVRC